MTPLLVKIQTARLPGQDYQIGKVFQKYMAPKAGCFNLDLQSLFYLPSSITQVEIVVSTMF